MMSVFKQPKSNNWSYRFMWRGREIRKSTKQTNKRVAEQMEAAARTALAKGEVGIKKPTSALTLAMFIDLDFLPFIRTTKATEPNTIRFYENCAANLKAHRKLGATPLHEIDHDLVQAFIRSRQEYRQVRREDKNLEVSTINRDLATLRRVLNCAFEWGRISTPLKFKLLPGENHRDRALAEAEEEDYVNAATDLGNGLEQAYTVALIGIRATARGQQPRKPDSFRLRDVAIIMLDAGLRPEEVYRLTTENVRDGAIWIFKGKTNAARRRVPIMTERLRTVLEGRVAEAGSLNWLFPADTRSGHMEESTLRKQHAKALANSGVAEFDIYTLRHTCLTRWGEYMDPWKLHKYAGHADMKTTQRYIHPHDESMQEAMARDRAAREVRQARGRHTFGHTTNHTLPA